MNIVLDIVKKAWQKLASHGVLLDPPNLVDYMTDTTTPKMHEEWQSALSKRYPKLKAADFKFDAPSSVDYGYMHELPPGKSGIYRAGEDVRLQRLTKAFEELKLPDAVKTISEGMQKGHSFNHILASTPAPIMGARRMLNKATAGTQAGTLYEHLKGSKETTNAPSGTISLLSGTGRPTDPTDALAPRPFIDRRVSDIEEGRRVINEKGPGFLKDIFDPHDTNRLVEEARSPISHSILRAGKTKDPNRILSKAHEDLDTFVRTKKLPSDPGALKALNDLIRYGDDAFGGEYAMADAAKKVVAKPKGYHAPVYLGRDQGKEQMMEYIGKGSRLFTEHGMPGGSQELPAFLKQVLPIHSPTKSIEEATALKLQKVFNILKKV